LRKNRIKEMSMKSVVEHVSKLEAELTRVNDLIKKIADIIKGKKRAYKKSKKVKTLVDAEVTKAKKSKKFVEEKQAVAA